MAIIDPRFGGPKVAKMVTGAFIVNPLLGAKVAVAAAGVGLALTAIDKFSKSDKKP